jgi:MFS family permease
MTTTVTTPTPAPPRERRGLFGLLTAVGVSILGTRMSFLAVPWFVLVTSGSAQRTGVVAFAEMAPYVLVQGFGGPLVDRLGAWRVSVGTDLVAALAVGAVPLLYAADRLGFGVLCALVAVAGMTRAAGDTSRNVMVPGVTDAAQAPMERGAGLVDGVNRLAGLLGAPAAGVLIAVTSAPAVLAVDAATFAVSAVVVALFVPRHAAPTPAPDAGPVEGYLQQLREGFGYLRADRLLLGIGAMVFVTNLLDQANGTVLTPSWVKEVTGSSVTLGLLFGAFGVGAVAGNATLTWLAPRLPRRLTYAWCFVLCGAPRYLAMAGLSVVSPVLAIALVSGFGAGGINPILGAVEYERVPRHLQARVLGAVGALAWAGIPLGSLLGGFAVEHLGLRPTLVLAGVAYALATLAPFVFPAWREMERDRVAGAAAGQSDKPAARSDR